MPVNAQPAIEPRVKICGLTEPEGVRAAVSEGAAYVGFVFFPKSPRNLTPDQASRLARLVPAGVCKVALTVNASDAELNEILGSVPIDMLQLHGCEPPERLQDLRSRHGLPLMKAVGIGEAADLDRLEPYFQVADQILVDAKPPKDAELPGGNGQAFDWTLLAGRRWPVPWMLAGGLTSDTVATALHTTGATQLDLSSGVESAPGIKSREKIAAFLRAAGVTARSTPHLSS